MRGPDPVPYFNRTNRTINLSKVEYKISIAVRSGGRFDPNEAVTEIVADSRGRKFVRNAPCDHYRIFVSREYPGTSKRGLSIARLFDDRFRNGAAVSAKRLQRAYLHVDGENFYEE